MLRKGVKDGCNQEGIYMRNAGGRPLAGVFTEGMKIITCGTVRRPTSRDTDAMIEEDTEKQ